MLEIKRTEANQAIFALPAEIFDPNHFFIFYN